MTINEKILQIRSTLCNGDNKKFAEMIGRSPQYSSNICKNGKSVGDEMREIILNTFPQISRSWFLADEGEMLKSASVVNSITGDVKGDNVNVSNNSYNGDNATIEQLQQRIKHLEEIIAQKDVLIEQKDNFIGQMADILNTHRERRLHEEEDKRRKKEGQ